MNLIFLLIYNSEKSEFIYLNVFLNKSLHYSKSAFLFLPYIASLPTVHQRVSASFSRTLSIENNIEK